MSSRVPNMHFNSFENYLSRLYHKGKKYYYIHILSALHGGTDGCSVTKTRYTNSPLILGSMSNLFVGVSARIFPYLRFLAVQRKPN